LAMAIYFVYMLIKGVFDITRGIDTLNIILILAIMVVNSVLVFGLKENYFMFIKSILMLVYCVPLSSLVYLRLAGFQYYLVAFGILLVEIGSYAYIYIKVKPDLDEAEFQDEWDKNRYRVQ
jgi:hypothetical protein